MTKFNKLNKNIVFAQATSRTAAGKMKEDAEKEVEKGSNAVIFFENRYHLYLTPGQDPYRLRKEIDEYITEQKKESKTTPKSSSSKKSK